MSGSCRLHRRPECDGCRCRRRRYGRLAQSSHYAAWKTRLAPRRAARFRSKSTRAQLADHFRHRGLGATSHWLRPRHNPTYSPAHLCGYTPAVRGAAAIPGWCRFRQKFAHTFHSRGRRKCPTGLAARWHCPNRAVLNRWDYQKWRPRRVCGIPPSATRGMYRCVVRNWCPGMVRPCPNFGCRPG